MNPKSRRPRPFARPVRVIARLLVRRIASRFALWPALAVGAGTAAAQGPPAHAGGRAPNAPNIVFIIADDLGYGDVGAYGQTVIRTPRLDAMARQGTRYTQFYAGSPVCAPSRSTLMTGLHTGHTQIRSNPAQVTPAKRLPRGVDWPLTDSVTTLAEVLHARGYMTGGFGKWGLGYPGSTGDALKQGFDHFFGYMSHIDAHDHYPEFLWDDGKKRPLPGNASGGAATYGDDVIVSEALRFIGADRARPFFLYVPLTLPHAQLSVPRDAYAPYVDANGQSRLAEPPVRRGSYGTVPMPQATYAAMVTRVDGYVGQILDRLHALGLDSNTVVFFTSDNGPSPEGGYDPVAMRSSGRLRGGKRDVYEGGIREPMIAWGPGRVPAARVSDHVWAMWDVLPTLAELAGAPTPAGLDGLSMAPAVTGQGKAPTHDFLYWEFHEQGGKQAVRRGDWKAVRLDAAAHPDGPIALYDLRTDVAERHDVASAHPQLARTMAAIMAREHTPSAVFPTLDEHRANAGAPGSSPR